MTSLANIKTQQDRIEGVVVLHVVEQPGVLNLKAGGRHGPAQEIEVFHAGHIFEGEGGIAEGGVESGFALHEVGVGFELLAHIGRHLFYFLKRILVAAAGHQ